MKLQVYRIQDADGRGPFKPGFTQTWLMDRPDLDNLQPWYVELGPIHLKRDAGAFAGAACRTLTQLRRWFTPEEYAILKAHGYQCFRIGVGRVLGESQTQMLIQRSKPFQHAAQPIELYPTTTPDPKDNE